MYSNYEIRRRAREQLQGNIFSSNWLTLLAFVFVTGLAVSVAGSVIPFGGLLLGGAAEMGLAAVCLLLVRQPQRKMEVNTVFYAFKDDNYVRSLVIYLLSRLYVFLWSLLFWIPGIVKGYAYSMAYYVSLDRPEMSGSDCITTSEQLMEGHKWQLFCLELSFIGWFIVSLLTFGIGFLFVGPYYRLAKTNFYESIIRVPMGGGAGVEKE